jgi:hypothetical protein
MTHDYKRNGNTTLFEVTRTEQDALLQIEATRLDRFAASPIHATKNGS